MNRQAAVAGMFYPATRDEIEEQIKSFGIESFERSPVMGAVAPHAGYQYSGPVAASVYARMEPSATVLLIGPNHGRGSGASAPAVSICAEGAWDTPMGPCQIDNALAEDILNGSSLIESAEWAHEDEHSLEVQIPFLQLARPDLKIVPIIIGRLSDTHLPQLASDIQRVLNSTDYEVTVVASTDFSHYVTQETAKYLDTIAIEKILEMDSLGLVDVVRKNNISMCGVQPTSVVLDICKAQGATSAELVKYRTSGDITGDHSSVVGYGGLLIR
jgi:hypothetical protein